MRLVKGDGGEAHLSRVVGIAKEEIFRDMVKGYVPLDVPDFATLHDYRDANMYGDLDHECQVASRDGQWPETEDDKCVDFWNRLQDALDKWIKEGGLPAMAVGRLKEWELFGKFFLKEFADAADVNAANRRLVTQATRLLGNRAKKK